MSQRKLSALAAIKIIEMSRENPALADSAMIQRGQMVYNSLRILKSEIDQLLLPLLANIGPRRIIYQHKYVFRTGVLQRVKGDILFIRDGLHKRRLNIKNIHIYEESVLAFLTLYK